MTKNPALTPATPLSKQHDPPTCDGWCAQATSLADLRRAKGMFDPCERADDDEIARLQTIADEATATVTVTMIDNKGYAYCEPCGLRRRGTHPCRRLRPHELNRLIAGEQLAHY